MTKPAPVNLVPLTVAPGNAAPAVGPTVVPAPTSAHIREGPGPSAEGPGPSAEGVGPSAEGAGPASTGLAATNVSFESLRIYTFLFCSSVFTSWPLLFYFKGALSGCLARNIVIITTIFICIKNLHTHDIMFHNVT